LSITNPNTPVSHLAVGEYGGVLIGAVDNALYGTTRVVLYSSDATLDYPSVWVQFEVSDTEALLEAIKAKTDLITGGGNVTLRSSIDANLDINIQQGDAIIAGSPNEIAWVDSSGTWANYAIASVTLYISTDPNYVNEQDFPATYDSPTATITLDDLLSSQTQALRVTTYNYRLRADMVVAADGPVTLVTGKFTVSRAA
jgi:hypothetical protein